MSSSAEGCVHRHGDEVHECRRYPAAPVLGGTREAPATVYRFAPCLARCGEYEAKPAPMAMHTSTAAALAAVDSAAAGRQFELLDNRLTCRGCYALGSACGNCSRCDKERSAMGVGQVVRHTFPFADAPTTCETIEVSDLGGVTRVRVREVHGRREAWL